LDDAGRVLMEMSRMYVVPEGDLGTHSNGSGPGSSFGGPVEAKALLRENEITGAEEADTYALYLEHNRNELFSVEVVENTFTGFDHALYIEGNDDADEQLVLELHDNTFDFDITAAPDVAGIRDVVSPDAVLDAKDNLWDDNN